MQIEFEVVTAVRTWVGCNSVVWREPDVSEEHTIVTFMV
jgi:hypothetical protein